MAYDVALLLVHVDENSINKFGTHYSSIWSTWISLGALTIPTGIDIKRQFDPYAIESCPALPTLLFIGGYYTEVCVKKTLQQLGSLHSTNIGQICPVIVRNACVGDRGEQRFYKKEI